MNPDCGYGWGTTPDTAKWEQADQEGRGSITTDEFISRLAQEYDEITARHGGPGDEGKLVQTNLYRETLGLEAFVRDTTSTVAGEDEVLLLALIITVSVLVGAIVLFAALSFAMYIRRLIKQRTEFQMMIERNLMEKLEMGIEAVAHCQYPIVVVSAKDFVAMDLSDVRDLRHEGNRDLGRMLFLDTIPRVEEFKQHGRRIIFMSYECLSFAQAGPDEVQFAAMKGAARELAEKSDEPDLSKWFIWLDVLSIPQEHPGLRALAINSLYTYASQSDSFVIIAPTSRHVDKKQAAGKDTYKKRVFCRAEQVAHYCHRGLEGMRMMGDAGLETVSNGWIQDVLCVFDGEMTCCRLNHPQGCTCDRVNLVAPLLGLFFDIYIDSKKNNEDDSVNVAKAAAWMNISNKTDLIFPRYCDFAVEGGGVERRELFGSMIERAQLMVNRDIDGCRRHLIDTKHRLTESVRQTQSSDTSTVLRMREYEAPANRLRHDEDGWSRGVTI